MEDAHPVQDLQRNGHRAGFDGLMDAGVLTDEDMGRLGALQPACLMPMEEFSRVAGQRKVARVDNTRELAEWGGCTGNRRTLWDAV